MGYNGLFFTSAEPINTMIMTFGNFPGSHLLSTVLTVSSLTPNGLACRLGVKLRPDLSLSLGQQSPGKQTPS
jgi:hypothetical protein